MAKRGTLEHPKNRRLARALKTAPAFTLGLLESIWHKSAQFHWNGRVTKLDLVEIFDVGGLLALYDVSQLIDAMCHPDHQWLEPLEDEAYYIHGWHEHCEDSVHSKLYRAIERFANGSLPSPKKIGKEERISLELQWKSSRLPSAAVVTNPAANDTETATCHALAMPSHSPATPSPAATVGVCDSPILKIQAVKDAWERFKQYRAESKYGELSASSEAENLTDLEKLGPIEAERVIRLAIRKGWKNIVLDAQDSQFKSRDSPSPPDDKMLLAAQKALAYARSIKQSDADFLAYGPLPVEFKRKALDLEKKSA